MFEIERRILNNEIALLTHQNSSLPLVSINAFIRAGKDQNDPELPGLASLTARMLDEGTRHYSSDRLSTLIESIGGELTIFSEREVTSLTLQLRSPHLGLGIEILSEMLRFPTFPQDRFEIERRKVLSHIRAMEDDLTLVGSQILNECVYESTPLAPPVLGNHESVTRLRPQDLEAFHRKKTGPQNTILSISGDFDRDALFEEADRWIGEWDNPFFEPGPEWQITRQDSPITRTRKLEKEQVHIFLGHLGTFRQNPDFYALQVMDVILGGGPGFSSRIPKRLRDQQGLAYVTYSDISGSSGVYPGRFAAYIGTSPELREKAYGGLVSEIKRLQDSGVTEDELLTAQSYLTGNFVFELQSNSAVSRFMFSTELFNLETDFMTRYPGIIQQVTRDDVLRVARRYLDTVNYSSVFVGSI